VTSGGPTAISADDIRWIGFAYADAAGRLFRWQGELYRAIPEDHAESRVFGRRAESCRRVGHNGSMLARVEAFVREHALLEPGQDVTCLVSGGADSTCLWHLLGELGYEVRALHVHHGVRGGEADADAEHCRTLMGAEVVEVPPAATEAAMRELRYAATAAGGLRATGHTASDQVETVILRLLASGSTGGGIKPRREDGVIRPLLIVWREETEAYCRDRGLPFRSDTTNADTKRGLIRGELLPLLERLDPRARASLLSLAAERPLLPRGVERTLAELLRNRAGTRSADLPGGVRAVREYDALRLEGEVVWGPWRLSSEHEGLEVRSRRPGDRLAGRSKKVQDLLVDAKVPRGERDDWPLVVRDGEIVVVPGIAEAPGWEGVVRAARETS
jgi:tRNA(Ile)-lysidine synthetase-like protein